MLKHSRIVLLHLQLWMEWLRNYVHRYDISHKKFEAFSNTIFKMLTNVRMQLMTAPKKPRAPTLQEALHVHATQDGQEMELIAQVDSLS